MAHVFIVSLRLPSDRFIFFSITQIIYRALETLPYLPHGTPIHPLAITPVPEGGCRLSILTPRLSHIGT